MLLLYTTGWLVLKKSVGHNTNDNSDYDDGDDNTNNIY